MNNNQQQPEPLQMLQAIDNILASVSLNRADHTVLAGYIAKIAEILQEQDQSKIAKKERDLGQY